MAPERSTAAEAIRSVAMLLRSSFTAAPARTAITLLLYPFGYLETPFIALGLRVAADGIVAGDLRALGIAVAVLVTGLCIFHILDHTAWQLCLDLEDRVGLVLDRRIGELVSGAAGLEQFERPEYADRLELLRERGWMLGRAMYTLPMQFADVIRAAFTLALLAGVHPLLLALPLFGIPSILLEARQERRQRDIEETCVEGIRRARHLYELSTRPSAGKEIRVFGLAGELRARHRGEWMRFHGAQTRAAWSATGASILAWVVFAVGFVGAVALVAHRVLIGAASVGDLVLTLTLAAQVNAETHVAAQIARWSLWVARIGSHVLWLEGYTARTADAHATSTRVPPEGLRDGIVLDNVSFRYPGTESMVLRDVSVRLPAGRTVAVVGENGAGKTTLVKLLCGFYSPTSGRILVDGVDLGQMELARWRERTAASFQDFHRFQLAAGEAVGIGDLPFRGDEERIRAALADADALDILTKLPRGLGTRLGSTWPDAVDLSIGQWQKVALARALMRRHPLLLVLDEPTASLDPQTEHELFERRRAAATRARGAVTLLVSHRFSTVSVADLIIVIEGGRVVEQGTHDDLVSARGLYAELHALQARAYARGRRTKDT